MHLALPGLHPTPRGVMFIRHQQIILAIVLLLVGAPCALAQESPAPPAPPQTPADSSSSKPVTRSRAPVGFLVHGTVFDQVGYAVPGAELHVRRTGEKKFHWSTYANSRGEFAMRVPPGNQYEVVVQSKGFSDATQPVNAADGLDEQSLVFRMEPITGRKK